MYKILGLLLMGSVVAFLGDRIGTRIGKKRLSILGMRPSKNSSPYDYGNRYGYYIDHLVYNFVIKS